MKPLTKHPAYRTMRRCKRNVFRLNPQGGCASRRVSRDSHGTKQPTRFCKPITLPELLHEILSAWSQPDSSYGLWNRWITHLWLMHVPSPTLSAGKANATANPCLNKREEERRLAKSPPSSFIWNNRSILCSPGPSKWLHWEPGSSLNRELSRS